MAAAGPKKPEVYSIEYIEYSENCFVTSTTHMVEDCVSQVERLMSEWFLAYNRSICSVSVLSRDVSFTAYFIDHQLTGLQASQ